MPLTNPCSGANERCVENFTPLSGLLGGLLIGGAAALLLVLDGRVAGVSGIVGGLFSSGSGIAWRAAFIAGLVVGPLLHLYLLGGERSVTVAAGLPALVVGGLAVGFGTRLGGGCTSGHGVCGIARFSLRSIVATLTFMAVAAVVVFVVRHAIGA